MEFFNILLFFMVVQLSSADVDLEVRVLQYDNPTGTSYHGMNYTSNRKCCDTGTGSGDCAHSLDTCDVVFAFCTGIIDAASNQNGCNGSYVDMKEDMLYDLNHVNLTQNKNLIRISSMLWWNKTRVFLTANIFDIDQSENSGVVDRELVDAFSQFLNITPAPNILEARPRVMVLVNHVRLAVSLKVWCTPGWFGDSCEHHCDSTYFGGFHDCSKNGSLKPVDKCLSKDLLVLSMKAELLDVLPLSSLQRRLVDFTATNLCPLHSRLVAVTMHDIRYTRFGPADPVIDVEFFAVCNKTTVSRLKFIESVYILNQHPLYLGYPQNLFNVPVLSPKMSEFEVQPNDTAIYFLVRIIKVEIKRPCRTGNSCNHVINFCFKKSFCKSVSVYSANNLTDCNGDLDDLSNNRHTTANTPNSTMLFSFSAFTDRLLVSVYDDNIDGLEIASFNLSLNILVIETYFSMAFPHTYVSASENVTLSLEIMSWCGKRYYGPHCGKQKPRVAVNMFRSACTSSSPCENNGICRDGVCICPSAWTGTRCSVDIDECVLSPCVNAIGCQNFPGNYVCNCNEGFSGQNCDQDVDECQNSPCQKGSTCLNMYGGFKCVCAKYWKGKFCNVSDFCAQGVCEHSIGCAESNGDFTCSCKTGWTNKTCNQDIDECLQNICSNSSSTGCFNSPVSYACHCKPGYEGSMCEHYNECRLFRPCKNGGRCNNVPSGHICHCPPAWTGQNCTEPVDTCQKAPCHNNGTCSEVSGGGFKCDCKSGWNGQFCTQNVNECTVYGGRKLCYNHGNCTDAPGSFVCSCDKGWTGTLCETDITECSSGPCFHNGTCIDTPGSFTCQCAGGWQGDTCLHDIDECSVMAPCHNNATCLNLNGTYECICTESWAGQNCTLDIDECQSSTLVCANGGTCQNTFGGFNCSCPPNWQGSTCTGDVDECTVYQPCKNSGFCMNVPGGYSCNCTCAWKGSNCSENVNECDEYLGVCEHGTCTDFPGTFNCSCFPGWQGRNCRDDVDECMNTDSCGNYSICINTVGTYQCQCLDGFTGPKCFVEIDECGSSPCLHNGTCLDKTGYYKCICPNQWDGLNCQIDINECLHSPCLPGEVCHNFPGSYSCESLTTSTIGTQSILKSTASSTITSTTSTTTERTRVNTASSSTLSSVPSPTFLMSSASSSLKTDSTAPAISSTSETSVPTSSNVLLSVDVFSLQFASPVARKDLSLVRNGIYNILKLLNCHDSSHIYVSLVNNSISNPKTVEFHAQCDGHHLTNEEINSAIRTLSNEKLLQYFPVPLKQLAPEPKQESWISGHIAAVCGIAGGVILVVLIVIICIVYKRKTKNRYQKGEQSFPPQESMVLPEIMFDMDGKECVMIANPTYDSLYQRQTQA